MNLGVYIVPTKQYWSKIIARQQATPLKTAHSPHYFMRWMNNLFHFNRSLNFTNFLAKMIARQQATPLQTAQSPLYFINYSLLYLYVLPFVRETNVQLLITKPMCKWKKKSILRTNEQSKPTAPVLHTFLVPVELDGVCSVETLGSHYSREHGILVETHKWRGTLSK